MRSIYELRRAGDMHSFKKCSWINTKMLWCRWSRECPVKLSCSSQGKLNQRTSLRPDETCHDQLHPTPGSECFLQVGGVQDEVGRWRLTYLKSRMWSTAPSATKSTSTFSPLSTSWSCWWVFEKQNVQNAEVRLKNFLLHHCSKVLCLKNPDVLLRLFYILHQHCHFLSFKASNRTVTLVTHRLCFIKRFTSNKSRAWATPDFYSVSLWVLSKKVTTNF